MKQYLTYKKYREKNLPSQNVGKVIFGRPELMFTMKLLLQMSGTDDIYNRSPADLNCCF